MRDEATMEVAGRIYLQVSEEIGIGVVFYQMSFQHLPGDVGG